MTFFDLIAFSIIEKEFRLSNSSALDTTTLELTPTSSVFEGNVTANSGNITIGGKTYPKLLLNDNQGVARSFSVGTDNETFTVRNETGSTNPLTILGSDNSATFAGNLNIDGKLILDAGSLTNGVINTPASLRINIDSNNNNTGEKFVVGHDQDSINNNNELFVVEESGNATFSGNINFGDSHFIGDDADDNLLIQSSANENIIIDSADDLNISSSNALLKILEEPKKNTYFFL